MKLSEFKNQLEKIENINIYGLDGNLIPQHFHITEAGLVTKHFIDCGGTTRLEKSISFQVWVADDTEHRLVPEKLLRIIDMSKNLFQGEDLDIEIEYQQKTIGKFGLDVRGSDFVLTPKQTACLALDACGVEEAQPAFDLSAMSVESNTCTPGGGCC